MNSREDFQYRYNKLLEHLSTMLIEQDRKNEFHHLNTNRVELILYKMASYGWYVDDFSNESLIDTNQCLKYIYGNFPEKLDKYFSEYYCNKIDEIGKKLKSKYTKRKSIISEAFYTHKNNLYHSSICLFITLIDGICDDEFDSKFFKNKKNLPEIKSELENEQKDYLNFIISPIKKKGAINGWEKELNNYPIRLNRHEIIHGKDVNYGNMINSLKLISMLSYIDYVLCIFKND